MKCYRKEDLKKIGYYRTEEQLQERLKEIECEAICVGEEELETTCKKIKEKFPSMSLGVQFSLKAGDVINKEIVVMEEWKDEDADGCSIKIPKSFISKGEYIVLEYSSPKVEDKHFNHMTFEIFHEVYVLESEIKCFIYDLKVEEIFHVTKGNVKFIVNLDGVFERAILPDWIENKVEEVRIDFNQEEYKFETNPCSLEKSIYINNKKNSLTFKELINHIDFPELSFFINKKVDFGNYIALMENGMLKVFSEEEIKKFGLKK